MSAQSKEIIFYKGNRYVLLSYPLNSYIESRKDLSFPEFSSDRWDGYQGFWKLENNKIYLTNIECENYTLKDIFKSDEPILAEWFTGNLSIGLGKNLANDGWNYNFENYLLLKVENGIVAERDVFKLFHQIPSFNFGKYNGYSFYDVLKGKINTTFHQQKLFEDYIKEIITFFYDNDFSKKIEIPSIKIDDNEKKIISCLSKYDLEYFTAKNFIAIKNNFYDYSNESVEDGVELFSKFLELILKSDFTKSVICTKKNSREYEFSDNAYLINSDINYLKWCIKEIKDFCIQPNLLDVKYQLKFLKTFEIVRLNSAIFEYKPIIETIEYEFPNSIKEINQLKFEEKHNVKYNSELKIYIEKMTNGEANQRFGHYLYQDNVIEENDSTEEYDDYYDDKPKYDNYNRAYGFDDETIESAFDGDPENYWNID